MGSVDGEAPATCAEVEAKFGAGGRKGEYYRKFFPGCECERHSVSPFSPGRLAGDEMLIRLVLPWHVELDEGTGDRRVPSLAVRGVDEPGLSMVRHRFARAAAVMTKVERLVAKHNVDASKIGHGLIRCSTARSLRCGEEKVFCVHDSATEEDPSHADIVRGLDLRQMTRRDAKMIYKRFHHDLASMMTVDTVFPGFLM